MDKQARRERVITEDEAVSELDRRVIQLSNRISVEFDLPLSYVQPFTKLGVPMAREVLVATQRLNLQRVDAFTAAWATTYESIGKAMGISASKYERGGIALWDGLLNLVEDMQALARQVKRKPTDPLQELFQILGAAELRRPRQPEHVDPEQCIPYTKEVLPDMPLSVLRKIATSHGIFYAGRKKPTREDLISVLTEHLVNHPSYTKSH